MVQKLIPIGNSVGIIIPQIFRQEAGLKPGDEVEVKLKGSDVVLSKSKKKLTGGVNAKFVKMVEEFIDEHEDVLKELARR